MIKWEDTTSYSRNDVERAPRWWQAEIASLRISVGNDHIFYRDGKTWLLNCHPWFNTKELKATNEADAKAEALALVLSKANEIIEAIRQSQEEPCKTQRYSKKS